MVLFWGAVWGLCEAVIGYYVHLAAIAIPGLPGFVMFPVAFACMHQVYKATNHVKSVYWISVIAALIKCSDFLVPSNIPIRIINPAICILYEGLAVGVILSFLKTRNLNVKWTSFGAMSLCWRSIFMLHLMVISLWGLPAALVTSGFYPAMTFLIFESLINTLLMIPYLKIEKRISVFNKVSYTWGSVLMILAVVMTIKL